VEYWGVSSLGFFGYGSKFIRVGGLLRGLGQLARGRIRRAFGEFFLGAIDAFVGVLEALSEFMRIVSFTFRLFGNMTAGELLLLVIVFLMPWIVVDVFYGLEVILGLVQALVFSGLTLVFTTAAVAPHNEEREKTETVSTE
jgi:F-type H+-transporting ATPase subunit a